MSGLAELEKTGFLWYLASPYTKYEYGLESAHYAITKIAAELIASGVHVFSPIAHTHPIAINGCLDPKKHDIWMPGDEKIAAACDGCLVAKMSGWRDSYGVSVEVDNFLGAEKPVLYLNTLTYEITYQNGEQFTAGDLLMRPKPQEIISPPEQPMTALGICQKAGELVGGPRADTHGDKTENHQAIAAVWNGYLLARVVADKSHALSAEDVANMMELLKVARRLVGAFNMDDYIDGAGYAAVAGDIAARAHAPKPVN